MGYAHFGPLTPQELGVGIMPLHSYGLNRRSGPSVRAEWYDGDTKVRYRDVETGRFVSKIEGFRELTKHASERNTREGSLPSRIPF